MLTKMFWDMKSASACNDDVKPSICTLFEHIRDQYRPPLN